MKRLFFFSSLLAASVVSAQSVADLPACSLNCFSSAVGKTSCTATDYACQCTTANAATIKQSVTACLAQSSCTLVEDEYIQQWSSTFCPNVLAAISTASMTSSMPAATRPTTSPNSANITPSSSLPSATPSDSSKVPASFGAGTAGTSWGNLPVSNRNANRGPTFEAISIILLSLAALILAFRFFARLYTQNMRRVVRGLGADEWFAVAALLTTAGVTADIIVGTKYGFGRHMSIHTTGSDLIAMLKLTYIFVVLITAAFYFIKMSILLLYLRMTPERSHHITIYVFIGVLTAHMLAALIGGILQCTPIPQFWSLSNPLTSPHCIDILAFDMFNSAWTVFEDLVLWVLPIPVIWNLRTPLSRKSGLYALIAISFIAVICSIVRIAALVLWMRSSDISWNYPLLPFLGNMEACVAIMTSSVPAIYPLFRKTERRESWSNPPPPMGSPQKEWISQDSQDGTAVPSTAQTDASSKRWSFLSKAGSVQAKVMGRNGDDQRHMTTIQSKSEGPRTELKSMFEDEEGNDFIPGLAR